MHTRFEIPANWCHLTTMRNKDEALLFVVAKSETGPLFLRASGSTNLSWVQKAVAFGDRELARLVNKDRRELAHPKPNWELSSKRCVP